MIEKSLEDRALDYGIVNAERVLRELRKRGGLNAKEALRDSLTKMLETR